MFRRTCAFCLIAVLATAASGDFTDELDIFSEGWPRAFFFRASEGMAANSRVKYPSWKKTFERLQGIEGKVLEEEVPGRSKYNIEFFNRFKKAHRRQMVLLHYNGEARDPRDGIDEYFAGHWVYFNGCKILQDVPAEDGVSEIKVENVNLYHTDMGRYDDKNEDIGLCALDENGQPDWSRAEQVQLISKDEQTNTLKVRRGCFGTKPRAFKADKSYAAAHLTSGPWGRHSNLQWIYNYSTQCPRDENGRSCIDVLVPEFAAYFEAGGRLEAFDGVEFDVMFYQRWGRRGRGRRGLDANADGKPDSGFIDGKNTYGIGTYQFCRRLRERLGDDIILLADGHQHRHQRAFGQLNGIESEGWPALNDWEIEDWSGGLNRHKYWDEFGREPVFNYFNHKWVDFRKGKRRHPRVPYSRHRLVFAAAQFVDAAVTYSFRPPRKKGTRYPIWDELWKGKEKQVGWLGEPVGRPRHPAEDTPDVLRAGGVNWSDAFINRFSGHDVEITRADTGIRVASTNPDEDRLVFRLRDIPCDGPELFVTTTMKAECMTGYPADIPRATWVAIARPGGYLISRYDPPKAGQCLRGGKETPIDPESGASLRYHRAREAGGETRESYFCHPPWRTGKTGYTFWQRAVDVPQNPVLRFSIAMGELSVERSDGVVFKVLLRTDARDDWQQIFEKRYNKYAWEDHEVSLKRWADQRVTLRFVTDAGPNDNSTTDHSAWGEPRVEPADAPKEHLKPKRYMTWSGEETFRSTFAFRRVHNSDSVDLRFIVESTEPVWLTRITGHTAADRMLREYENGVVLANPAYHPATFNLQKLFDGDDQFRRIKGSQNQDPETNNGKAVGEQITLGERDGMFLAKVAR